MAELVRTNDPALIAVVEALLGDSGIPFLTTDRTMSVLEGSIGAIQVRILVPDRLEGAARGLLAEADLGEWLRH